MHDFLLHIYDSYGFASYFIIITLTIFDGPIISIILGSILKLGYLNLYLVYLSVIVGDMIGDLSLYYVGYKYGDSAVNKIQSRFSITQEQVNTIKNKFVIHKYYVLFLSKVTNGFGLSAVILLTAGIVRIPLLLFAIVNLVGQLLWSGVLLLLGYMFVGIYIKIDAAFSQASWVILAVVLLTIGYLYYKYGKQRRA